MTTQAPTDNRCPNCRNRVVRAKDGGLVLFLQNVIVKSDGAVEGTCSDCRKRIAAPKAALDALRGALGLALA